MITLVTGGVRSGKSRVAEQLLEGQNQVTYVATAPRADDADWSDRIAAHHDRRPSHWSVVETTDVAAVVRQTEGSVLVDCLGTWLTARLDALDAWEASPAQWVPALEAETTDLVAAVEARDDLVFVTNEVGLGLVAPHRSGRVFADRLGLVNQQIATACDRVILVVSGQQLVIK
ncbi:bifunctional adenosylcobinamide kinase/adenosylcobinamide-phosphate guanylyltransferase [Calidifontibacter terrae]